jgi:hypothetical protein
MGKRSNPETFWNNVDKTGSCWTWRGATQKDGYGILTYQRKFYLAHRLSYLLAHGIVPDGLNICHTCDNPVCVNPDHLFAGTQLDNVRDMINKSRQVNLKGSSHGMAKLTEAQVSAIRAEYVPYVVTSRHLSDKYCITVSSVKSVLQHRQWKHVA